MMKKNQTKNGKAFEYACLNAINTALSPSSQVQIDKTPPVETAEAFFLEIADEMRYNMMQAAKAAVRVIISLEPQLMYPAYNEPLYLSLQSDARGRLGDVRDILCIRKQNDWEIGLSCKHNHHAVKHSRLSATIDFGSDWFDIPCSHKYFDTIVPIFEELGKMRESSNHTIKWSEIEHKDQRFYVPVLCAFLEELQHLDGANLRIIPEKLIRYLIGKNDFYKIITDDAKKTTRIEAMNLYGSLNRSSDGKQSTVNVPRLKLPTRFYHMGFKEKSNTTVEVVCDEGWAISMRIHSAETFVTPSLKFDISLISLPHTIHAQVAPW